MSLMKIAMPSSLSALAVVLSLTALAPSAQADSTYQAHDTSNHAFWLPGAHHAVPGTNYKWVEDSNPMLSFHDGTDWSDANYATLTGQIYATDFWRGHKKPSVWEVHIDFGPGYTYDQWIGMGGDVKVENNVPESVYKTWRFYELDPNGKAQLNYVSGRGGHPKTIDLDFYDSDLIFQVGLGASMKNPNDVLGASAWIASTTRHAQFGRHCRPGHGDINIELTPTAVVPTPSAAMAGLLGLGLLGVARRKRRS